MSDGARTAASSPLSVDMHTHILPGIDDGARDWDATMTMIAQAAEEGTGAILATPHYIEGRYQPSAATIRFLVEEARRRVATAGLRVEVHGAQEVHATAGIPEMLERGEVMSVADRGRHLLVEFPYTEIPRWIDRFDDDLRRAGLRPILAHPERCAGVIVEPERLYALLERGWLTQIDANSLRGRWGDRIRLLAEEMLRWGWIHVVGSDAHHPAGRPPHLAGARARFAEIAGAERADLVFSVWPRMILEGKNPPVPPPDRPATSVWRRLWSKIVS